MTVKMDQFVVATYALWAGDFEFAERILRECSTGTRLPKGSPEDLVRRRARTKLGQLRRRKEEFENAIADHQEFGSNRPVTGEPLVLQTEHMRATVWRVTEREFQMQAYLSDLSWEQQLFNNVHREREQHVTMPDVDGHLGVAWTEAGGPVLQIEVTDLGQIEVSMVWTDAALPASLDQLATPLGEFLRRIDPGSHITGQRRLK